MSHYDLLGIARTASRDEIVAAAQAVADVPGVDTACAVLLDDARRAAYDRDLDALATSYVDVAQALPLDPLGKLDVLATWLAPSRAAPDKLDTWAQPHPALDGEVRR